MNVLIPLLDGFDELEAVTFATVLRQAGISVTTAGIPGIQIKSATGTLTIADRKVDMVNLKEFDALVLVGGDPGYKNMSQSKTLNDIIHKFGTEKKTIAALSQSPLLLKAHDLLDEIKATVYPGFERELPRPRSGKVILDGNILTANGSAAALEAALKLTEKLAGAEAVRRVKQKLVL